MPETRRLISPRQPLLRGRARRAPPHVSAVVASAARSGARFDSWREETLGRAAMFDLAVQLSALCVG